MSDLSLELVVHQHLLNEFKFNRLIELSNEAIAFRIFALIKVPFLSS
jgi:hypothetical protein